MIEPACLILILTVLLRSTRLWPTQNCQPASLHLNGMAQPHRPVHGVKNWVVALTRTH
jgi:hypothetical protein